MAFNFDERILIEEYINGREVTVGILDEKALPVIEIIPKKRFFDYEAKYQAGMTDYIVPAKLEDEITRNLRQTALSAHKLLGCFGCSRVDMILSNDNVAFVLEVNTIPGLTQTSLLPKAAKVAGIDFPKLCIKLIQLAYEKAQSNNLPVKLLFGLLTLILVLFFSVSYLASALKNSGFFNIKALIIRESEARNFTVDLSYLKGRNILTLDLQKEEQFISQIYPGYRKIRLVRVLPDRLFADFLRRRPVAYVKLYRYFCVDEDGVLFRAG